MTIKEPESMDDLVYFTRRVVGEGKAVAWVYRGTCPECKKGVMGKPINEKTGKPKTRADNYVCKECGYDVPKQEYEDTLECEIKYTCPKCKKDGEIAVPFVRKNFQILNEKTGKKKAAKAVVFECGECGEKIPITKKMKS